MKIILTLLVTLISFAAAAQNAEAIFNKAEGLFANEKYTEAAELYSRVVALDSDNLNGYLRRGFCFSVLKQYEKAVADFSVVIDRHGKHPFAYISRGSAYNKLKKFETALIDFDLALNLDPKNQEAYNNRGWAKNGLGLYKEACADWKKSKKLGNEEAKIILKNNSCK